MTNPECTYCENPAVGASGLCRAHREDAPIDNVVRLPTPQQPPDDIEPIELLAHQFGITRGELGGKTVWWTWLALYRGTRQAPVEHVRFLLSPDDCEALGRGLLQQAKRARRRNG